MFVAPVHVATTGPISLTGEQTIDGTAVVDGERVLVKNQADAVENGVYVAAVGAWSRASDFGPGAIDQGTSVIVLNGATQAKTIWVLTTANPIVVGTTALEFRAVPDLSSFVTRTGAETLANKTFSGSTNFYTNNAPISITSAGTPVAIPLALVHIVNENAFTCGLRVASYWTGTTATPYQNNDTSLWEVHNTVQSNSLNRSWAGSFANAYNAIPAGVTDSGTRVGAIGWAVSAAKVGYEHAGTLAEQIGVHGTAGFQGPGSPAGAAIVNATGVRGYIYNDSAGAVIGHARAGEFISTATTGIVEDNIAVYASAGGGTTANWAFYGNAGAIYNAGQALFGGLATQSSSNVAARDVGNSYEFGHPDPGGYGSNIGATQLSGFPFLAFCAEAEGSGNTFQTRGKPGVVIRTDLAGALIFARVTDANASGQNLTESGKFDASGNLSVNGNLSATGAAAITGALSAASLTLGTDLPVSEGGTGASTAAAARTNLELGTAAVKNVGTSGDAVPVLNGAATTWAAGMTIGGNVSISGDLSATGGGTITGALSAGSLTLGTDLPVAEGGTGASTAAGARTNLGLGTAAVKNVGTSGDAVPVLNGAATTWAAGMTIGGGVTASGQLIAGGATSESSANVVARKDGNGVEFGSPTVGGYGSNIGATQPAGYPFVALCAEADTSGNAFRTRGKLGVAIRTDLAGALIFGRLTNANAGGQSLTESGRFDASGNFSISGNLSATGAAAITGALSAASLTLGTDLPVAEGGTGASTAAGARTNLGLGTAAVKNVGTSGDAVPVLNGAATTWAAGMTIGGGVTASGQLIAGGATSQSSANVVARKDGNGVEFGHPNGAGYASNLGGTASHGYPFLAFCAEAESSGNTFRTRGKLGAVVSSDLTGAIIFSRLTNANGTGQSLTESARFDASGHLVFAETPVLKQRTPASATATGVAGEICWDTNYLYVCTATNTWKRAALATW